MEYADNVVSLRPSLEISRDKLLNDLVDIQFERNDSISNGEDFASRGEVEIFPASRDEHAFSGRIFGDEIDRIREVEALTGQVLEKWIIGYFPSYSLCDHDDYMEVPLPRLQAELEEQLVIFEEEGQIL